MSDPGAVVLSSWALTGHNLWQEGDGDGNWSQMNTLANVLQCSTGSLEKPGKLCYIRQFLSLIEECGNE